MVDCEMVDFILSFHHKLTINHLSHNLPSHLISSSEIIHQLEKGEYEVQKECG